MRSDRTITQEHFDSLLSWLDADRDHAGTKYEQLRRSLIMIFTWRGLSDAEDLADETINRVALRVQELAPHYRGDPAQYFYGVAKNLIHESWRKQRQQLPISDQLNLIAPEPEQDDKSEKRHDCLERCLRELSAANRELLLSYYSEVKTVKVDHRREIATQLNIEPNTLRVRMYRIRSALEKCIVDCVEL
jgi:RNA polymerase sigma factor (sigma-70 family)